MPVTTPTPAAAGSARRRSPRGGPGAEPEVVGKPGPPDAAAVPDEVGRAADEVGPLLDLAVERLGGAPRDGQHAMAQAVAEALDRGEHLLVQAGTGTGKSLAYLVPAVRHAVREGERVVVSTATLALQRQVLTRDLPLVAEAVAPRLPRPPALALLKGWHNYVCVHKATGGYPAEDSGTLFALPADAHGEHAGAADHPAPDGGGGRVGDLGAQVLR